MKIVVYRCPICRRRIKYEKSLEQHIEKCFGKDFIEEFGIESAIPMFEKIEADIKPTDVSTRYLIKSALANKNAEVTTELRRRGMIR